MTIRTIAKIVLPFVFWSEEKTSYLKGVRVGASMLPDEDKLWYKKSSWKLCKETYELWVGATESLYYNLLIADEKARKEDLDKIANKLVSDVKSAAERLGVDIT